MNMFKLTGMDWVKELLTGHPIQFSDALAMPKHVIIHHLLDMIVSPTFYNHYIKLPDAQQTPPEIRNDPKLYPFKDCH
ncbi:hypothetical protein AZE42_11716 [Rhizopogon vesiculosus]|uniref:Uncharacterized protein n=1 Tax=Rhizopogon vesiculosus TaxID=180088 RepID=A0A1J8QTP0_9AGAM|nr:hypothetical protein AZE42_11716 [Rhizopogon vesiculosus]